MGRLEGIYNIPEREIGMHVNIQAESIQQVSMSHFISP